MINIFQMQNGYEEWMDAAHQSKAIPERSEWPGSGGQAEVGYRVQGKDV